MKTAASGLIGIAGFLIGEFDVQIIGGGAALRNITIIFYAANEVISLLENTGALGVPYPKKMLDVLEQLKNREK